MLTGTIINSGTIVVGAALGIALKGRMPDKVARTIMQGLGLFTMLTGFRMALEMKDPLITIFSVVVGGIIGELIDIEAALGRVGEWAQARLSSRGDHGTFGEAFVSTTLLFCVGPMAITGAIADGLKGDYSILLTKSVLDGLASVAFASGLGVGVAFSAVPIFVYQGGLTLLAGLVSGMMTPDMVAQLTAVGGILIAGIGINILEICRVKVGNLLPGLFMPLVLVPLVAWVARLV